MATEKKITSRIQQKHDVAANWAKATNFIPKKGEIIIYDAEYNASGEETQSVRFKIGDGSKTVNNLPFAVIDYSSDIETLEQKVANNSTAIGALQENTVPKTRKINNKALSSDITLGAADVGVNETTFPGLKKTGTVTGVKMNGTTKNPSSGVVDLGTVITAHQSLDGKQDKITSSNKLAASLVSGLATVATSGSYNDLSNKPTISTVNNGTLTIQKNGTKVQTFTANQSSSVTANITVPTKVSELTNDSGYTTNKGTVTSVSVKMNGASKGTVTSSGTIDLGTVITAHQDISGKLDKTTYEVNKTINFGQDGALYVGKFKVYDTNVTCEVTSTTNVTYSGKLVIATQNYVIMQMTVYGDAANTVAPNFFVKPSTTSDPYIEIYFKPASWSKNVVHIYGSAIAAEPTNVCTNVSAVPSTATSKPTNALNSKANLNGGNSWTGDQQFNNARYYFATDATHYFTVETEPGDALVRVNQDGFDLDTDELGNMPFLIAGSAGTSGQVLTSQGAGKTPIWGDVTKHGYTQLTNEDLNTIVEVGWYRAAANNSCTNKPPLAGVNAFVLVTEKGKDTFIKQTVWLYHSSFVVFTDCYCRCTRDSGNSWGDWSTLQMVDHNPQAFYGRKTFSDGISLSGSLEANNSVGTAGQVLTSQGENNTPIWTKPAIKSATLSGTTLTITL